VRFFGSRVDSWLADLDEVIDGRGDGVVALKRGRLKGVKDTVVRHFSHLSFNQSPLTGEAELVLEDMMERLSRDYQSVARRVFGADIQLQLSCGHSSFWSERGIGARFDDRSRLRGS